MILSSKSDFSSNECLRCFKCAGCRLHTSKREKISKRPHRKTWKHSKHKKGLKYLCEKWNLFISQPSVAPWMSSKRNCPKLCLLISTLHCVSSTKTDKDTVLAERSDCRLFSLTSVQWGRSEQVEDVLDGKLYSWPETTGQQVRTFFSLSRLVFDSRNLKNWYCFD